MIGKAVGFFRTSSLQILAVLFALVLWAQVHGQGTGSISMDVPLQVEGLSSGIAIVNNLPDHVRITVSGLQARLNTLTPGDVRVPLDMSHVSKPGVLDQALEISAIRLPIGLSITKLQPDRLQVQLDRIVQRMINVKPRIDTPQGWEVRDLQIQPLQVMLEGPEVWLEALLEVETTLVHPQPVEGPFRFQVSVESPSGKAIRVVDPQKKLLLRGMLVPAADGGRAKEAGEKR